MFKTHARQRTKKGQRLIIEEVGIVEGAFDNVGECMYAVPSHWDIGKVYKRLIKQVAEEEEKAVIESKQLSEST